MLMVNPSMKVSASSRLSSLGCNQFLISMDFENLLNDGRIKVKQITSMSSSWKIEALQKSTEEKKEFIAEVGPREVCSVYFRATRHPNFVYKPDNLPEFATSTSVHNYLLGDDITCLIPSTTFYFSDILAVTFPYPKK